jgi:hypothetical protein
VPASEYDPFALVVLAQLAAMATRRSRQERLVRKTVLARRLYERSWRRADVEALLSFIDWVLALPEEDDERFWGVVEEIERERSMPYKLSLERVAEKRGREEGRQEGRQEGRSEILLTLIERKFGPVAEPRRSRVLALTEQEAIEIGLRLLDARSVADLGL